MELSIRPLVLGAAVSAMLAASPSPAIAGDRIRLVPIHGPLIKESAPHPLLLGQGRGASPGQAGRSISRPMIIGAVVGAALGATTVFMETRHADSFPVKHALARTGGYAALGAGIGFVIAIH